MSCALRCPSLSRPATSSQTLKTTTNNQFLRQLARFHPNQLSSYIGVKLLLPAQGRVVMNPQGSAAVRKPVQMSFLGVGAPEAILVAVVALVVFGPKGLAEAARSVGSTLRAFKPTIKEVVQVSQELKGTLEKELGIEEIREAARPTVRPSMAEPDTSEGPVGTLSDTMAKVIDPEIEAKRAASAQMAWGAAAAGGTPEVAGMATVSTAAASAGISALSNTSTAPAPPSTAVAPASVKDISTMSMEELEAELTRRRAAAAGGDKRL
ncbi:hypothetical protein Vretimale_3971 [Volvox reticuliferus]|uniref:Uncharacterized protein n=1 Tax=Volvox reticuliferus TaxID=1737510 RepID=A0A8J4DD28_9CHLO|nr:hypothetical protein Vretifemale_1697 [Volvox reticuliferus]GIL98764.1 hypothetical protein Vretimale_3971 [Volvox reticuliferus]